MKPKCILLGEQNLKFIFFGKNHISVCLSQNYFVPNNYNPADFYIATLAVVPSNADKSKKFLKVNFYFFNLGFLFK